MKAQKCGVIHKLKEFIAESYGAGINMRLWQALSILGLAIAVFAVFFFRNDVSPGIGGFPEKLLIGFSHYAGLFILLLGVLVFLLYIYSREPGTTDRYRVVKISLTITVGAAFFAFLMPLIVFVVCVGLLGKSLRIGELVKGIDRIVYGLCAFFAWVILTIVFFGLTLMACNWLSNNMIPLAVEAKVSYSMFFGLAIGNKLATLLYFKMLGPMSEEEKKTITQALDLLWASTILIFTFLLKPLGWGEYQMFADAAFYSTATLTLLTKVTVLWDAGKSKNMKEEPQ